MDNKDFMVLTIFFLISFYLWNLPIKNNPLPFGEGDSAWHFAVGDYISLTDKTITRLPMFIEYWYFHWNPLLGIGALQYPPPPHVNYAIMQVVGGERIVPMFVYKAVVSFLGVFSVYFLLRKLYGFYPAALAGFALIFSTRNILIHLWGQQPILTGFIYLPIVTYSYYKLVEALYENKNVHTYAISTALLFACQFFLHLEPVSPTIFTMGVFTVLILIKRRRLPVSKQTFSKQNILAFGFAAISLIIFCLPFWGIYFGAVPQVTEQGGNSIGRLFQWSFNNNDVTGSYPPDFVDPKISFGAILIPFAFVGLFVLLLRRNEKDLLMLSILLAVYITEHLDIFLGARLIGYEIKMLVFEPYIVFALMAIGATSIPSLLNLPKAFRNPALLVISIAFALYVVLTLGQANYNLLNSAYAGYGRITPVQVKASEWMMQNLPKDAAVWGRGTITYPKLRWMLALSHKFVQPTKDFPASELNNTKMGYALFDYSDLSAFGKQAEQQINQLMGEENALAPNMTLLYDKDMIRIYKLK